MDDLGACALAVASALPSAQKHILGVKLRPLVAKSFPESANTHIGVLLELDNSVLRRLLLGSEQLLRWKVDEAFRILGQVASNPHTAAE